MNYRPIIIVAGEPNSIFLEIYFKALKEKFKRALLQLQKQTQLPQVLML